jgi:hypothetical protein
MSKEINSRRAKLVRYKVVMPRRSTDDKQLVVNQISNLLGIARDELGPGSKEHKSLLQDIAMSIAVSSSGTKQVISRRIVEALGEPWDKSCYSKGGSVTTEAFGRMLRGLRRRVEPHRANFDIAVMELLSEPMPEPPIGNRSPRRVAGPDSDFIRCPMVAAWILQRCRGVCGYCGDAAPFVRPNRQPYLEVHHVLPLSEGGPDTVDNAIALCPNCHRRVHHGSDRRDVRRSLLRAIEGRDY